MSRSRYREVHPPTHGYSVLEDVLRWSDDGGRDCGCLTLRAEEDHNHELLPEDEEADEPSPDDGD